jgi:hypothetical protein
MQDMAYIDLDNLRGVLLDDDALRVRKLMRRQCGNLRVTSGRIVACDPMVLPDRQAFVRHVPSPARLAALEMLGDGYCPDMPEQLHGNKSRAYLEHARRLKKPVDAAPIALLEQSQAGLAAALPGEPPAGPIDRSAMGFLKKWFS